MATTRNDAPPSIAPHDETAHRRWHVLPSAAWSDAHVGDGLVLTSVDDANGLAPRHPCASLVVVLPHGSSGPATRVAVRLTEVLRVAPRHLVSSAPPRRTRAPAASRVRTPAEAERDLVIGPSQLGRTSQCLTREEEKTASSSIGEPVSTNCHRFSKSRGNIG
jgi:hypothetical protein